MTSRSTRDRRFRQSPQADFLEPVLHAAQFLVEPEAGRRAQPDFARLGR